MQPLIHGKSLLWFVIIYTGAVNCTRPFEAHTQAECVTSDAQGSINVHRADDLG